jgi:hypothetical protein
LILRITFAPLDVLPYDYEGLITAPFLNAIEMSRQSAGKRHPIVRCGTSMCL